MSGVGEGSAASASQAPRRIWLALPLLVFVALAADSRRATPPAVCGEAIDVPLNIA